ncbi:MAG: 2-oxo acid dehydrogenase subunit E2 [Deltaproteobacteria bacterium]|nr:2-oxo acid dehydrogenase subunit E2 [Deltaproteobacteria bacterium]
MSPDTASTPGTAVLMPKIGQAMSEGIILQWHKQDGEHVNQGEVILTIETDKATYDLEAQASGILKIHLGEGREVKVGTVVGEIGDGSGRVHAATLQAVLPSVAPAAVPTKTPVRGKKVLASPKAKQLAAEHGIDLTMLTAASADGVISASDIEQAIVAKPVDVPAVQTVTPASGRAVREQRQLVGMRKTAARRLQEAWRTIPHIVQMIDIDAAALLSARVTLRQELPALTVNDLLLHAAAHVLAGLPDLNGTVEDDMLTLYDGVDIGFAVDTPRGLVVPVIRRAETLSVAQVAAESQRLIEAARAGRLRPEDIGGASLTISNLGMFGISFGTPVINLGESILVFVGAVEERPVVRDGQVVVRPMLTLSIAYDHRLADGVAASQFTRGVKKVLEAGDWGLEKETPKALIPHTQHPALSTQEELAEREVRSVSEGDGYAVQVQSRTHQWLLDEPVEDGGTDRGPTPVDAFLGALLSCMTISFKAAAKRRKIALQRLTGRVHATPRGHLKTITMTLEVWSSAPEADVRALLDVAKRGCYVSGVLKPEISFSVELEVRRG